VLAVLAVAYLASVGPGYFLLCLAFAANLAPLTNVAVPNGGGPLWSLAVEEQFYLVWPVLVLFLSRRTLIYVLAGIVLVEPVLRFIFKTQPIELTWFRCDGLAIGALLALWWTSPGRTKALDDRLAIAFFAAAATLIACTMPFGGAREGPLSRATRIDEALFCFAGLLVYGTSHRGARATALLRSRFATVTADLSYCLYLIHVPLIDAYDAITTRYAPAAFAHAPLEANLIRAACVSLVAYGIAAISRHYLELPFINMGRLASPSRAAPSVNMI